MPIDNMRWTNCRKCGHRYADHISKCPRCGTKTKRPAGKKAIIGGGIAAVLAIFVAAVVYAPSAQVGESIFNPLLDMSSKNNIAVTDRTSREPVVYVVTKDDGRIIPDKTFKVPPGGEASYQFSIVEPSYPLTFHATMRISDPEGKVMLRLFESDTVIVQGQLTAGSGSPSATFGPDGKLVHEYMLRPINKDKPAFHVKIENLGQTEQEVQLFMLVMQAT